MAGCRSVDNTMDGRKMLEIASENVPAIGVTLLAGLVLVWFWYRYRRITYLKRLGFPGPEGHIIFGNMRQIRKVGRREMQEKWIREYGKVYGYYQVGPHPTILVADRDVLKAILVKEFHKFTDRPVNNVQRKRS